MNKSVKLEIYSTDTSMLLELPYADWGLRAGFPSPAENYICESIDLNKELVKHKETTFYARVAGDSLRDAGIGDGDIVVIDKSLEVREGDIVVAFLDGEFTLKEYRLDRENNCAWLVPHNKSYPAIRVTEESDFRIWGVVTSSIKRFRR